MKTTTTYRTDVSTGITVSTVCIREGRATLYETSLIAGGKVSDGRRSATMGDAGREHDFACAVVRGQETDRASVRVAFYAAALAEVSS